MLLLLLSCLNAERDSDDTDITGPPDGTACSETAFEGTLALDPDGPDTQIHVASTFDGEAIWLTWNRPAPSGRFQVFVAAMACDGTFVVDPTRVDEAPDNQIDPTLAVRGDEVLVVWQSDNGTGVNNLDIRMRRVDRVTGATIGGVLEVEPRRAGAPFTGSLWMASIAPSETGWWLAGSAAVGNGFRAFLTELDAEGMPVGEMLEPLPDETITQQAPIVGVDAAGQVHLVFQGEGNEVESWYSLDGGPATSLGGGSFPGLAPEGPFVGLSIADAVWFGPDDAPEALGPQGSGVALASSASGGFVGWLRNVSGLSNEIKVSRFDATGAVGPRVDLGTASAAPYGWNLTPITDDLVFVAWQEGTSPAFRTYGRFVRPE